MNQQVLKRGNLVKILQKKSGDMLVDEEACKFAIIEHSYAEKYGFGNFNEYSIIMCDTGISMAWKTLDQLEFIDEGGEFLFDKAKEKFNQLLKNSRDIEYILPLLDEGHLNSESILYLFEMIGFKSSYLENGEYYILYSDWEHLHIIFVHIKNSKTVEEAKSILNQKGLEILNIEKVFNEFHKRQWQASTYK